MKKIILLMGFMLAFVLAGADPQLAPWKIITHPIEPEKLEKQVSSLIQNGYLPSGMEVVGNEAVTMLYVYNEKKIFDKWLLKFFGDMDTLSDECNALINKGWVPFALSRENEGLFILFLNVDLDVDAWTITTGAATPEAIKAIIERYNGQGYACYGITTDEEGKIWFLFLKTPKSAENKHEWLILPNNPEEIRQMLDGFMSLGWLPWGITRNEGMFNILVFQ